MLGIRVLNLATRVLNLILFASMKNAAPRNRNRNFKFSLSFLFSRDRPRDVRIEGLILLRVFYFFVDFSVNRKI